MKTILIVLVMMATANGNEDLFIISEPTFSNDKQCIAFVQQNSNELVGRAQFEYEGRPVQDIFCVDQKKLATMLTGV
tara:strand:+ start:8083 stop:8313 length:231 start_codon:yes stop_codon:yes gene_type:complete